MLFDKKAYYNIIKRLEFQSFLIIIMFIFVFTFTGFIIAHILKTNIFLFSILGMLIGIILGTILSSKIDLQILDMKMKLDIYDKIMKNNS